MRQPMDHQPPRRQLGDARGVESERMSDYFDFQRFPEKADRKVTRKELLAWLMRQHSIQRETRWYRRLWKYLMAKRGTPPAPIAQPAKADA